MFSGRREARVAVLAELKHKTISSARYASEGMAALQRAYPADRSNPNDILSQAQAHFSGTVKSMAKRMDVDPPSAILFRGKLFNPLGAVTTLLDGAKNKHIIYFSYELWFSLEEQGRQWAVAHELSHIKHNDVLRAEKLEYGLVRMHLTNLLGDLIFNTSTRSMENRADEEASKVANPSSGFLVLLQSHAALLGEDRSPIEILDYVYQNRRMPSVSDGLAHRLSDAIVHLFKDDHAYIENRLRKLLKFSLRG